MRKLIIALLLSAGVANGFAQATQYDNSNGQGQRRALFQKKNKESDAKYLSGAVPMVDGKVVFTLDQDVPGKNAKQIYEAAHAVIEALLEGEEQMKESRIVLDDTGRQVAARIKEWMTFRKTALNLDRTIFNYSLVATATEGHLNVVLYRISYQYEMDRDDAEGMNVTAEEWISDENALTKNKKKLSKYAAKFRRKTVDRKDEIFKAFVTALNNE